MGSGDKSRQPDGQDGLRKTRIIKYSFWSQSSALLVKSARNQVRRRPSLLIHRFKRNAPSTDIANPKVPHWFSLEQLRPTFASSCFRSLLYVSMPISLFQNRRYICAWIHANVISTVLSALQLPVPCRRLDCQLRARPLLSGHCQTPSLPALAIVRKNRLFKGISIGFLLP
jgi:hypothetical protein